MRSTGPAALLFVLACAAACAGDPSDGGVDAPLLDARDAERDAPSWDVPPDAPAAMDGGADAGASMDGGTDASSAIDLSIWKLTLPTGEPRMPREILWPELATFDLAPYFVREGTSLRFRAHAGGVTTSGSAYPRSELREMEPLGTARASWSTSSGRHVMRIEQAITHLPEVKPHVVAGQIHDAADDVVMIRLERDRLFVEGEGTDLGVLDDAYVLGTFFTVTIEAEGGRVRVDYGDDGTFEVDVPRDRDGCYFKAGAYTQSNVSRGDLPDAYGEVVISALTVRHEP